MSRLLAISCICIMIVSGTALGDDSELVVKPYGFILTNFQFNDNIKADIPTVAVLSDTTANTVLTARQTRFGLTMSMEERGWKMGGKIELDFWGLKGFGKNGGAMQSAPRLRLAYFQIGRNKISMVFGQDWVCFAPLSPESDAHVSIPGFSSSGNLWNRMPQIRLDYKRASEKSSVLAQLAIVRPLASDKDPSTEYKQSDLFGAGEVNKLPFLQTRLALALDPKITVGVSGHFGQEDFETANADTLISDKTTTYAAAIDAKAGLGNVTFMGEGFFGANLITLFSNASWFREPTGTGNNFKYEPTKAMGGWGSIGYKVGGSPVLFNIGAGIEIINDEQIDTIATRDPDAAKFSKNFTVFGNVLYSPFTKIRLGMEIGYIKSSYKTYNSDAAVLAIEEEDASNLSINLSAKFSF